MGTKFLVVIDMQNDFVTGALSTPEAQAIVPGVIQHARDFDGTVVFTKDTHDDGYAQTQEGRNLPVPHCLRGSDGWRLVPELEAFAQNTHAPIFEKPSFGSLALAAWLNERHAQSPIECVELIGVCTDICVVSNALLIKATLPEVPICVCSKLCAGVTPEAHEAALATMRSCQVNVR